jgi:hypothetical protein
MLKNPNSTFKPPNKKNPQEHLDSKRNSTNSRCLVI